MTEGECRNFETRFLLVYAGLKFEKADMQMIRWMCGVSIKDIKTNKKIMNTWEKCMEIRVESGRPVGIPRNSCWRM